MSYAPISFAMPDGRTMQGYASDGPATEIAYIRHEMPDGSYMLETVIRAVEPAPAPTAEPPQDTPADAS